MSTFVHTADDIIVVDGSSYPLAFFLTQEAAYALPAGADRQHYDDVTSNRIASNGSTQLLLTSVAWADGDSYIANKATYDAAYVDYVSYPDLATAKLTVIALINSYSATIKSGTITYSANDYSSAYDGSIHQFLYRFARYPNISPTFALEDVNGAEHILTIDDLRLMANLIDDLWLACDNNRHVHVDAVNALGTIVAVKAYDYTTGWPSVPYTG